MGSMENDHFASGIFCSSILLQVKLYSALGNRASTGNCTYPTTQAVRYCAPSPTVVNGNPGKSSFIAVRRFPQNGGRCPEHGISAFDTPSYKPAGEIESIGVTGNGRIPTCYSQSIARHDLMTFSPKVLGRRPYLCPCTIEGKVHRVRAQRRLHPCSVIDLVSLKADTTATSCKITTTDA